MYSSLNSSWKTHFVDLWFNHQSDLLGHIDSVISHDISTCRSQLSREQNAREQSAWILSMAPNFQMLLFGKRVSQINFTTKLILWLIKYYPFTWILLVSRFKSETNNLNCPSIINCKDGKHNSWHHDIMCWIDMRMMSKIIILIYLLFSMILLAKR